MSIGPLPTLYDACAKYIRLVDWATTTDLPDNSPELLRYAADEWRAEQQIRRALAARDAEEASA